MSATEPHPIQVRLAFGHGEQRPEIAEVVASVGDNVTLRYVHDGVPRQFLMTDVNRFEAVLRRPDVCRLASGDPLALVNSRCRMLAVAVGPAILPSKLVVNYGVARLENGVAVELPADSPDQPSWHLFVIEPAAAHSA